MVIKGEEDYSRILALALDCELHAKASLKGKNKI